MGIGFGTIGPLDTSNYCHVISNFLKFGGTFSNNRSYEEINVETIDDLEDICMRDAPRELKKEIKSTINELKKSTWEFHH